MLRKLRSAMVRPGRLITAQAQQTLQSQRADAVLLVGHEPDGGKPVGQRHAAAIEDRSPRYRDLARTAGTAPTTARQAPACSAAALRTAEAIRPAQPLQIVDACLLVREPGANLLPGARIIRPRSGF